MTDISYSYIAKLKNNSQIFIHHRSAWSYWEFKDHLFVVKFLNLINQTNVSFSITVFKDINFS